MTRLVVILVLAFVVRLGYVGLLHDRPEGLMMYDSTGYLMIAESIVEQGRFGRMLDDGFRPETHRLPGYPAWLALFRVAAGNDPLAPVLGQAALNSVTCLLIALLAARLDPRLGFAAGLFAAVNPTMVMQAAYVMSESLFLFAFTGWMLATVSYMARPTVRGVVMAGLLLGLAAEVRTMIQFAVPLFPLVVVVAALRGGARPSRALLHGALALVVCVLVLAPVALRNHALFGELALTSQGGGHALMWIVPAALEFTSGVPFKDGQRRMAERLAAAFPKPATATDRFATSARAAAVAREALSEIGAVGLARAWFLGAGTNLALPGLRAPGFRRLAGLILGRGDRPSIHATPGDGGTAGSGASPGDDASSGTGRLAETTNMRGGADRLEAALIAGATAATVAVRLVQVIGLARVGRRLVSLPWLFMIGVALYVLLVTGPVTGVRYRLPLEPLLMILFACALVGLRRGTARAEMATPPASTPPT